MGQRIVVVGVQPSEVDLWKEPLSWHFASFCRDGSLAPDDLWREIREMKRQLWVAMTEKPKAAVLTGVRSDRLKTFEVTHAAGEDMRSWVHFWPVLEDFAKSIGCKRIEAIARPGWERVLKDMTKTHVILEKRL